MQFSSSNIQNFLKIAGFCIVLILHTINWKVGLTQKKSCRNAIIVLSILMINKIDPMNFFNFWVWPLKIFEVKGGQHAEKLEFGQTKKISIYQLFKTRICAFMTYVQFRPKSSSNLRSVVWDSKVWGLRAMASNPWIPDDKSQIWVTFRPKLNIGHKSTYSSFKKLV